MPTYGMYLLTRALRDSGNCVVLADLIAAGNGSIVSYEETVRTADLIGIGCTSMSWPTARSIIAQIRAIRSEVPIVLGGIHPTMFDDYLLRTQPVEFIVRGEGELALVALTAALENRSGGDERFDQVPNLTWRSHDNQIIRNTITAKMSPTEMASFAVPDYSELPDGIYLGLSIESSRGCSFDCSFCSTSYRTSFRGLEPDVFVDRLEAVIPHLEKTRYKTIHIIDDEFSMNPRRAIQIARSIENRCLPMKRTLIYDSRANDILFPEYAEAIAPLTYQFLLGAECGYDEGLLRIGKGTTCKRLTEAARTLNAFGIADRADYSFVLGLPWETKDEVNKTVDFAIEMHIHYGVRVLLQWYCEIPGSRLWQQDFDAGLVTPAMYDDYGFFSDLYLFRVGVKLSPTEILNISNRIASVQKITNSINGRNVIEHSFPAPIARYFPAEACASKSAGLVSLREVAQPHRYQSQNGNASSVSNGPLAKTSLALRHFPGVHEIN
jgi:anaerobic magnesium-protoporphyrin IX monomethyl ester cyclase